MRETESGRGGGAFASNLRVGRGEQAKGCSKVKKIKCYGSSGRRRGICVGAGEWKANLEIGPAGHGFEADCAVMIAHDAKNDVQAKAGAFADRFCGEERLEDAALNFRRDARAVVYEFHEHRAGFE